jgi:leader peptidase (prepilin peptidase) / N-methyltransferase
MACGGALLGAIIGSFIATLIIRWPQGRSVLMGRSHCDHCDAQLRALDLVPFVSHVITRGKCRACGSAIDPRHLAIELVSAVVGATAFGFAPGIAGLCGAVFGWALIALAALDVEHFWLPDRLTLPLAALGIGLGLGTAENRVIGGAVGYAALAGIAYVYKLTRGREGLGGGDPKLFGAIGAWLGWQALPFILLGASGTGLIWVSFQYLRGTPVATTDRLPLGALMAIVAFPLWIIMTCSVGFTLP